MNIQTDIVYLADLPIYKSQKPYFIFFAADSKPDDIPATNVEVERRPNINITDIRGQEHLFRIDTHGFETSHHESQVPLPLTDNASLESYKRETEQLLKTRFDADAVFCWEARIRENFPVDPDADAVLDMRDPLVRERPASATHIDATAQSGPKMIRDHLPGSYHQYLNGDMRIRIVNTWRPMLPVIEDRPLAFTDYFSVNRHDLVAVDRITPWAEGEVYYLKYNPKIAWYWLSNMTWHEPLLMLTYDTAPGDGARCKTKSSPFAAHDGVLTFEDCAHSSVENPLMRSDAPKRQSVETRSIVISKS